ncbi:acyltransferase family protein [Ruminococcaceae bacterium OttesenSCG-928-I18]|nr:acyltransferase family protein [Ruminococcaceae bacterium OttesenSCG-928-I18]
MGELKQRNFYFDNAKFLLIVLVVLGHTISTPNFDAGHISQTIYRLIFLFHMPCFVFISGYFSKGDKKQKIGRLVYLYLACQTLYYLVQFIIDPGQAVIPQYIKPQLYLWYFLALIQWKILLPFWRRLKHPILVSVLVALAAGYDPNIDNTFNLSRMFAMMPFFLLGYYADEKHIVKLKELSPLLSLPFFAGAFLVLYFLDPNYPVPLFFYSEPYHEMGLTVWYACLYRLAALCISFVGILSFLCLVPSGKTSISPLGQRTVPVYVLHGYIEVGCILLMGEQMLSLGGKTLYLLIMMAAAFLLSTRAAEIITSPLFRPTWVFQKLKSRFSSA